MAPGENGAIEPDETDEHPGRPLRTLFGAELDQLRLQVEVLAVRVDENLERMRAVLDTGAETVARRALAADDDIDAMTVSLTARCYDLLAREGPVAGDLRFVVSVLRVLPEIERIGDLALRVVNTWPDHDLLRSRPAVFGLLTDLADAAVGHYREAMRAWATQSAELAAEVVQGNASAVMYEERLLALLVSDDGSEAGRLAVRGLTAGKAMERIADHAGIIVVRLLYLLTGDTDHLSKEVR